MLTNMICMVWTWLNLRTVERFTLAYATLNVKPCFNARSHTGQDGKIKNLEPLTALYVYQKKIKLGEWEDLDKLGIKSSPYSRGFSFGWFGVKEFQWKMFWEHGRSYLDGFFLRKNFS